MANLILYFFSKTSFLFVFFSELSVCPLQDLQALFLCLGSCDLVESPVLDVFSPVRVRSQRLSFVLDAQRRSLVEVEDFLVVELDVLVPDSFEPSQFLDFLLVHWFSLLRLGEHFEELGSDFVDFAFKEVAWLFLL